MQFPASDMMPPPAYILQTAIDVYPTGSRATCAAAVTPYSDHDWLVLVHDKDAYGTDLVLNGAEDLLAKALGTDDRPAYFTKNKFNSYRLGPLNLIVIEDVEFFNRFKIATLIAHRLQVENKGHRIALFEAVNFGAFPIFTPTGHATIGAYLAKVRAT